MTTPTELARQHQLAALRERSIVRTEIDVPSSAAARALQRLSVRSRWGKLTAAQRSAAMKRVRAAATTRPAGTAPQPGAASAAGSTRSRRAPKSSGR